MNRREAVTAISMLATFGAARAQSGFPDRSVTLIVPWAPGGSTDVTARTLAKAAEQYLGQSIVIVNVPGASTSIGMTKLAREKPDGYTVGTLSSSAYMFELSGQKVSFDTLKDFSYVCYYGDNLIGVTVLDSSPLKTMADLVAESKKRRLTYGTAGANTTQSFIGEAIKSATGGNIDHIPMNGSAGSLNALLANQVDFIIETSVWQQYVANGRARLLAVNTEERSPHYPNVPTLKELGIPSLRSVQAILAPRGVPEPVRLKLEGAFLKATRDPAFVDLMNKMSMTIIAAPGKEAEAIVSREYERAKRFAQASGSGVK